MSGVARFLAGPNRGRAEIIIGLVGALGTDLDLLTREIQNALLGVNYQSELIRVSELIQQTVPPFDPALPSSPTALDDLMDLGDVLRRATDDSSAAAGLAAMNIAVRRRTQTGNDTEERQSFASIVRQLKHPDEVALLRFLYGPRFVLIGGWSTPDERWRSVHDRLRASHHGKEEGWYAEQVRRLLDRDEKAEEAFGQRVRATFQHADAYVAITPGKDLTRTVSRLIQLLFGSPYETPTRHEQAMFQAAGARLRSADPGRQVGAVVIDRDGELLVTGTNEVPKPGGGQYWSDDATDFRDFRLGSDENELQKVQLVSDVLHRLRESGTWLLPERQERAVGQLATEALQRGGPLEDSRIGDLLEFGRIAHAEMAAISTAARRGTPIGGQTMYTTTYPCHECARLIIAAGLRKVVYVDPYPKSQVPRMFRNEITEGASNCEPAVVFEPFEGVAPRLYEAVFAMRGRSRDTSGSFRGWDRATSLPRLVADAVGDANVQTKEDTLTNGLAPLLDEADWGQAAVEVRRGR